MKYDYGCKNCGHKFEAEQSMNDDALSKCPVCWDETSLRRIITGGAGFVLKGGGWAADNYSKSSS